MKIVIIYTFSFLILLLSGCSNYKTPSVYRIDIQQGNDITQEMISQLEPDMSKSQVAYVMGTPLIIDTFNPDRWDYLYSFRPGNGLREQRNITIYFKQDKLDYLSGNTRIATLDELVPVLRIDSNVIVPLTDKKIGFFNEMKQTIGIQDEPDENTSQQKRDLFNNRPVPIPKKSAGLIDRIVDSIGSSISQTTTQKVDSKKSSLLKRFISLDKDESDAEKRSSSISEPPEIKEPLATVTKDSELSIFDQVKNAIGFTASTPPN
jgi:outer membrane protein assembly factor BamE|tara:strand:+ start:2192 stop:2980 length:789 start_codon:yes stop_codon:yes gene_type:complete